MATYLLSRYVEADDVDACHLKTPPFQQLQCFSSKVRFGAASPVNSVQFNHTNSSVVFLKAMAVTFGSLRAYTHAMAGNIKKIMHVIGPKS